MKAKYAINQADYAEVKNRRKQTKDKRLDRKLQVIELRYEGKTGNEIASKLDYSKNQVSLICKAFVSQGIEEFCRQKYTSHKRLMSLEQEKQFLQKYKETAEKGQIVSAVEIKKELDKLFQRDTGKSYVYNLLKRHGWRKIMPRSRHPKKASEAKIEASKKLTIPTWTFVYSIQNEMCE